MTALENIKDSVGNIKVKIKSNYRKIKKAARHAIGDDSIAKDAADKIRTSKDKIKNTAKKNIRKIKN